MVNLDTANQNTTVSLTCPLFLLGPNIVLTVYERWAIVNLTVANHLGVNQLLISLCMYFEFVALSQTLAKPAFTEE